MPGGGDIWCIGPGVWERVGEWGALLLTISDDKKKIYRGILILVPPGGPTEESVRAAVVAAICARNKTMDPEQVVQFVASRVRLRAVYSLHVDDLVACLPSAEVRQIAVIVPDAARYRGDVRGETPDRTWCASLAHIAKTACELTSSNDGYVLFDAGRLAPDEPEALALLMAAHSDCGVTNARISDDDRPQLPQTLKRINALLTEGCVGEALAMVESLSLADGTRSVIKGNIFVKAGVPAQAIEEMQAVRSSGKEYSAEASLHFASISLAAFHHGLAAQFIGEALRCASTVEELERALELADEIENEALVAGAVGRLKVMFPRSPALLEHQVMAARLKGDLRGAAALLEQVQERAAEARFYSNLADKLEKPCPDHKVVLIQVMQAEPEFTPQAQLCCVQDAQRRGRWLDAVDLVLTNLGQSPSAAEVRLLVSTTRSLLLNDKSVPHVDVVDALVRTTEFAVVRLAQAPSDASTRAILGNLLSTEESGLLGRFALRKTLFDCIEIQPDVSAVESVRQVPTETEYKSLWNAIKAWLDVAGMIVVGRSHCPAHLVPPGFHAGILWRIISELDEMAKNFETLSDEDQFIQFVGTIVGFAPHLDGPDRNLDIEGLKLAASCLARANRRQRARDVIEMVLQIAGNDPARCRAAWFAYAEVHRLTGDPQEAALAVAAGLSRRVAITRTAAFYEAFDIAHLLRDLSEYAAARRILVQAAETLDQLGLSVTYGSRLAVLRQQIDLLAILHERTVGVSVLEKLLADAVATARSVLATKDDTGPITAVLIQTLRLARERCANVPADADVIVQELMMGLAPREAKRLKRLTNAPTIEDLSATATEINGARYGHNLAKDIRELAMLSRRYLLSDAMEPAGAAFAIEFLADHGLLRRDQFGFETPAELPQSLGEVLRTAMAVSRTGLNLVLLGLNEGGRLVRVDIVDGEVRPPLQEPLEVFSTERLVEWRRDFPARYSRLSERKNDGQLPDAFELMRAFDDSMRGLGVSSLPSQRVVIIPDAALADLPVNLLPVDGAFAGEDRAMATAPSLHWLSEAEVRRAHPSRASHAWVPTANAPEDSLLPRVADDLAPILAAAGISMTQDADLPPALQGAELAIVAAHGGLSAFEGRYFRSVADEVDGVMASMQLAHGLAGAKVAILFVCNATRLDMEPGAQANLGLARMLLDRGCSAVVGSPWPLQGGVPRQWLEPFLEAWNLEFPVIDATSYANEKVRGFADTRHALHVYGDPLVRRQPMPPNSKQ